MKVDHSPLRDEHKEGKPATLKIMLMGDIICIWNEDRSLYKQIDDKYVSSFIANLMELQPMKHKYAAGRIGTDENGDVTFRIDKVLDEKEWPSW